MISSTQDLEKFLDNNDFKNIFILCGEKSFSTSGASDFIKELELNKRIKIYYKKSYVPVIEELITITDQIKNFNPDLILAISGGL